MKKYFYCLSAFVAIISLGTVLYYLKNNTFSHTDVAITVATILGLALTTIGTVIGVFAIIKSHDVTIKQSELAEREFNQKLAKEIYENLLTPLQHVMNDIQSLGDSLFIKESRQTAANGKIIIPEHIPPQMEEHANMLYAKLNMLILYTDKSDYQEHFEKAKSLSVSIKTILKSYNDRTWKKETSESLLEAKKTASTLYNNLVDVIGRLKTARKCS